MAVEIASTVCPHKLKELLWPHVTFYSKQREIIDSVWEDDETVVRDKRKPIVTVKFWSRVNKGGPAHPVHGQCWLWIGFIMKNGYGKLAGKGLAHRLSWAIHFGNIPSGMRVLHKCDTPACVNPAHLFLGTAQDNSNDMVAKGRVPLGTRKVTEEDVREIRRRYRRYSHKHGSGALSREFGICIVEVWRIVKGERWGQVC